MFKPVDPKPSFPKLEEAILKFWEDNKIFEKSLEQTKAGKPFTFYDGPPFATGLPHYGHILASTIKDVIPRYQTMNGRFVRRRWGWDCHGLPIEEIVERLLKISGKKQIEELGIGKFNETCRSKVLEFVAEWRKTIRRIARWVDFDNSYKTMDRDYMESVWWAFKQIYDKGLVYEGRKVLLYCPRCETPVSNFEVAMDNSYKEVTEEAVTVKFKVKGQSNTYLLAWTTTPWTLPGNIALAVDKDIEYVKVKVGEEFYILAKNRLSSVIPDLVRDPGLDSGSVAGMTMRGEALVNLEYEPLFDVPEMKSPKSYKVYSADFVNTEEGTGIVHTAVVYGEDDYALGMKEGVPVVPLLDEKGKFNEKAPELVRGQYFKDAEKFVKKDLEQRGLLLERKMHEHSYPHCWRCGTTLYYNAIPAWFINIEKIRNKLLASNKKEINWYPEHLKHGRYEKSVEAAPDWNISRNRYWGNPIPIWRCAKCGKNTVVGSIEELKEKATNGIEPLLRQERGRGGYNDLNITPSSSPSPARFRLGEVQAGGRGGESDIDLHRPYIDEVIVECDSCGGDAKRITEIFDSWFEAGSMPFAEFHYPFENKNEFQSRLPAQFVAEYIAQTRAWFYVMHVISFILFGRAPFENVVTTGTILAEDGSKMSKSKNNYPDPWLVMEKYGVDSLRFYLMNSVVMQADNLNFSEKDLATVHRKVVLILWNVYNYFVTYANSNEKQIVQNEMNKTLDQWIEAREQELINSVSNGLDEYNTVQASREIEKFINDLSTWYLRRSRGRDDQEFFTTLQRVLENFCKIIAPFMPYVSEEIYRNLNGEKKSVHLAQWPEFKKLTKKESDLLGQMAELKKIVEQVHALRAKAGIKLRQPLAKLIVPSNVIASGAKQSKTGLLRDYPRNDSLLDILKDEVNVKEIAFGKELALDTNLTADLKLEGLTAELTRQIQNLRKESGLKVGQMAELYFETESDMMKKAMEAVDRKKTYLESVKHSETSEKQIGKEINIDGHNFKFQITNVKSKSKSK